MQNRYYYKSTIQNFLRDNPEYILGQLTHSHGFVLEISQRNAWLEQIENLKEQLNEKYQGHVFFEFIIPRMGKRVDVILYIENIIFVLEYKTGAKEYFSHDKDQALDYALDLKNFHEGSHHKVIVPILIATKAKEYDNVLQWDKDLVFKPLLSNGDDLFYLICEVINVCQNSNINALNTIEYEEWSQTNYKPTPTIIEAAQALYQGHNVEEISRSDAGAQNLSITAQCIEEIIQYSKQNMKKSICFVTGVPGAGKTLAGLNISTRAIDSESEEHAVFLSGNGPLVLVLREALARDEVIRGKTNDSKISKSNAARKISSFIQNIHHFRDSHLDAHIIPHEQVVIFDEAQRAWDEEKAEKFMARKKGHKNFNMSEPEFLISIMDRKEDWAVIICLIGGGQEINTGEAGLIEWFNALQNSFADWDIYHSDKLADKIYNWGEDLQEKLRHLHAIEKPELHLSVSMRSFRAEKLSAFVAAIIDGNAKLASAIKQELQHYPIFLTRDLNQAKAWLRKQARGSERYGLLASSGAIRLKPEGIHVKRKAAAVNWFLNDKLDIRSSYYLEDIVTEFDIQGLELDWTAVCWDADFRFEDGNWGHYNFRGKRWENVNDAHKRVYLANAYRVLLTRARQGMVIFVPKGDDTDHTRPKHFYDNTYDFLVSCGIEELKRLKQALV